MLCFIFGAFRTVRTIAQFGSALDWGSRGRGFKSRWSDQESPSFRRFPRHRNGGFFRTPGAVRGDVLRTSAPGHAIRMRSRFPHVRVPSSLGRDVPGGWHGRPERLATHPLIDHPDRALEAGIFARAYTAISASGSPGNASSTIPHAVPAIVR